MAYQAPYSGLAQLMEMQGRRGDSMLVHMNPMEVRMLEAMSPDGSLSINPDTGLPEAFKLKDIAAFALPIAASIAFPMIAPAGLSAALGSVGTAAVGAGLGGFGAGLIQGKGVGDSLIQGGLSGLMSYGLGSAFAPAAPGGNIPTAPSISPDMALSGASVAPDAASLATFNATQNAAAGNTPGLFARLGNSITSAAQKPLMPETLSSIAPESYAKAVAAGAAPTYGSALTAGGSGLLSSSLLAPEEMPYDIADMYDMDAYYASRIPDLEAGRRRGRAMARKPTGYYSPSDLLQMATTRGYNPPFLAAEGGRVPTNLNINGEPHQLSYINQDEADLLRSMGGSGQDVMGIPAYYSGDDGGGIGSPGDASHGDDGGGIGDPGAAADAAGMGVGGYSDAQSAAVSAAMDAAMSEADAEAAAIGEAAAYGDIGSQAVGMGFGGSQGAPSMSPAAVTNSMIGRGIMDVLSPVPTFAVRGLARGLGTVATALGVPGTTETASAAVASQEASQDGSGGDSGVSVYGRPYGDPYNTEKVQASPAPAPSPVGLTALRSLSPTAPRTAGDIFGAATTGGIPRFFTTMAQGGVVQAGIGGLLKALSPAALAADTMGVVDVDKMKLGDMLQAVSPAAFFAKDPKRLKYLSPAYMASQKPSALSPAATVMINRGMAQGGGISSLAYGGDPAPIGFANQAFEGMVPGQGTGMSDSVPFSIEGQQPALLSRDEYVLPADVVSQLGDGSSSAGADMLDNFISQVRQTKYGNTQQPAPVGPQLMTGLMKQGGVV